MTTIDGRSTASLALALAALLADASPASAGECGSPCTVSTAQFPFVELIDTTLTSPESNWIIGITDGGNLFRIGDRDSNNGFTQPFQIEEFAGDNLLFLDAAERIGIKTSAPAVDLQINDTLPEIRLNDTSTGAEHATLRVSATAFGIAGTSGFNIFSIDTRAGSTAAFIDQHRRLGLGTLSPEDRLHLAHTDPTIRFTETDQNQSVFRLRVDTVSGNRRFVIQEGETFKPLLSIDQDSGRVGLGNASLAGAALEVAPRAGDPHLRLAAADGPGWTIDGNDRVMIVSREGTGGDEFIIRDRFDAAGPTLAVQGSVQGTQCINTSSREVKTGFSALDPAAVLAALADLPVTTWRYRHEAEGARHIGPVAEDFQAKFGLGDGRTISTVDAAGVLMAAVQGLQVENRALHERLEAIEERLP